MNTLRFLLFAFMLGLFGQSYATIRTVNQFGTAQFVTINDAINAAVTGDTILVAPGTYAESPNSGAKRLSYIGAGWDLTTVTGFFTLSNASASRSIVEGFRIDTGTLCINTGTNVDSLIVRRCLLRSNANVNVALSGSLRVTIEDCLVLNSSSNDLVSVSAVAASNSVFRGCVFAYTQAAPASSANAFHGNNGGTIEITNCTFLNFAQPFALTGVQPVIAINNVFYDWVAGANWGTFLVGSVFDYNAAGGSAPAFPGGFTNNIALGANDPFVTYSTASNYVLGTSDLHLNGGAGGLALTNTGHPLILDLDASPSDIGAYGGPKPLVDNGVPAFPFVTSLTLPNLLESGDSLNVSSTGRVGPRY